MELLAPAGSLAMAQAAYKAGADAIYIGLKEFNMRHSAKNFTLGELKFISKLPIKKYLTINTIIYDNEIKKVERLLRKARPYIDAVICWDIAVLQIAKKLNIPIHLSTQASVSNCEVAKFFKKLGVERIIPARELNLKQIKRLAKVVDVEVFVHGAMCVSISGRCFMSQELFNRSANRGKCIQPCRREYLVTDKDNKEMILGKDYIMSAKDLCILPYMDKLKKAGVKAVKIEGRSRSVEYVDVVTKAYRKAIDQKLNKDTINKLMDELKTVYNRKFSTGFYFNNPEFTDISDNAGKSKTEIGKVINYYKNKSVAVIKINSEELNLEDDILVIGNKTGLERLKISSMEINKIPVKHARKGELVAILTNCVLRENDKVYKYE